MCAQKRMFDKGILETDAFMDMPMPTKALYFLLGMEADDEGFVSPKRVMKIYGGNEDDLKVLIAKEFVIQFESGVIVITDWHENNWLDTRRVKETKYQVEKRLLTLETNKYRMLSNGEAPAKRMLREYSIEENSIEEKRRVKKAETSSAEPFSFNQKLELMKKSSDKRMVIISSYWQFKGFSFDNQQKYSAAVRRDLRAAANLIGYEEKRISETMFWLNGQDWLDWSLETVHKYIDKDLTQIKQ